MPSEPAEQGCGNWLLTSLGAETEQTIVSACDVVALPRGRRVFERDGALDAVYFPLSCCLSDIARVASRRGMEVGTVGREGLAGLPLLHGVTRTRLRCIAQIAGTALKMTPGVFIECLHDVDGFAFVVHRYAQHWSDTASISLACNAQHRVAGRCARWLLMTQDRVGVSRLPLTHDLLAIMLGVRRASVSDALQEICDRGLIAPRRGEILILDRERLVHYACDCYEEVRQSYANLLPAAGAMADATARRLSRPAKQGA